MASCGGIAVFAYVIPASMGVHDIGYVFVPNLQRPSLVLLILELIVVTTSNPAYTSSTSGDAAS